MNRRCQGADSVAQWHHAHHPVKGSFAVELPSIHDLETIQANKKGKGGTIPKPFWKFWETLYGSNPIPSNPPEEMNDSCVSGRTKKARRDLHPSPQPEFPISGGAPGSPLRGIIRSMQLN